jgi:hypothetical protein
MTVLSIIETMKYIKTEDEAHDQHVSKRETLVYLSIVFFIVLGWCWHKSPNYHELIMTTALIWIACWFIVIAVISQHLEHTLQGVELYNYHTINLPIIVRSETQSDTTVRKRHLETVQRIKNAKNPYLNDTDIHAFVYQDHADKGAAYFNENWSEFEARVVEATQQITKDYLIRINKFKGISTLDIQSLYNNQEL